MERNILIVVNKVSGNGLANKVHHDYYRFLKRHHCNFFPYYTTGHDDISNIRRLIEHREFDSVSVLGGDGTLNIVVNAIGTNRLFVHVIPCGSGNDIATKLSGKQNISDYFYGVLNKTSSPLDVFSCNDRLFCVSFGIGFEGAVCESVVTQRNMFFPKGLRYWAAILRNLLFYKDVELEMEGEKRKVFLLSLANNTHIGGGFKMAPLADVNDQLLELVVISKVPWQQRVKHLLDVKKGQHLELKFTEYKRVSSYALYSENVIPAHVDGELLFNKNYVITYSHSVNFLT